MGAGGVGLGGAVAVGDGAGVGVSVGAGADGVTVTGADVAVVVNSGVAVDPVVVGAIVAIVELATVVGSLIIAVGDAQPPRASRTSN